METDRYRILSRVVKLGSFSKAAEELGYTQSAVSQAVSALEAAVGFRLVVRNRSGLGLTPEGGQLLPLMENVLHAQRLVQERVDELANLEGGTVRIGTIASISEHWLPSVIAEYRRRWPLVEFVIHQGDYASIAEWVRTGKVDFGFVNPGAVKGLRTKTVAEGAMVAVLAPDHPLAALERVPLSALAAEPFILLEEGGYYEPLEAFAAQGLKPDVRFTIHDDFAIMAMVEQGLGVSVLAELVMGRCAWNVVWRPCDPSVHRVIALAWKDDASVPRASRRFMELVEQRCGCGEAAAGSAIATTPAPATSDAGC